MDRKIDKTHWQEVKKIHHTLHRQGETTVTQDQVEKAVALRPKDKHPHDPKSNTIPSLVIIWVATRWTFWSRARIETSINIQLST